MPKVTTDPITFESCISIDMKNLRKWGYIKANQIKGGGLQWRSGDQVTNSIAITSNTITAPYIELGYNYRNEPVKQIIQLTTISTHIGGGKNYFFICPVSGKRCKKLYFICGRFVYRFAFSGIFYQKQIESKTNRDMFTALQVFYDKSELPKFYKTTYSEKLTKRYLRRLNRLDYWRGKI